MGLLIDDSLRKSSVSEPSRNFPHDPNMRQEYQMNHEEQVQRWSQSLEGIFIMDQKKCVQRLSLEKAR
ncbi:hypothetical protein E4U10_003068 [Claviceps purpurea]|nr:hypothetical protein E4U10_003068 [Claviceps purpurea]